MAKLDKDVLAEVEANSFAQREAYKLLRRLQGLSTRHLTLAAAYILLAVAFTRRNEPDQDTVFVDVVVDVEWMLDLLRDEMPPGKP